MLSLSSPIPPHRLPSPLNSTPPPDIYSDSRSHGYQGSTRNVRLPRVTTSGGGAIAKSDDGIRCVVSGKESLRIVRVSQPPHSSSPEHKSSVGRGGHRIDASRNLWDGSGLKIDSSSTDVAWAHGPFSNKILTSARNGELIMWDLHKSGSTKYERRTKDHIRSINKLSVSNVVEHYCITGSADGDLRVWDLRDLSKSLMRIHHPISIRSVVFSPISWQPLQAIVGLDNGSIYRWDLQMGQRGQLDRLPVAHSGPVTTLDWCNVSGVSTHLSASSGGVPEGSGSGHGWVVSGGLDRCVKVWDLTTPGASSHIPHRSTYTLHVSFPVRRVIWRPSYECEVAVVSNAEFGTGSNPDLSQNSTVGTVVHTPNTDSDKMIDGLTDTALTARDKQTPEGRNVAGDAVEIWDVRREWVAKWSVTGSTVEGGVTDIAFGDSHALWAQHSSGMFSQIDLRNSSKPIEAISRVALTWEASGSLAFVSNRWTRWEVPYDDVHSDKRSSFEERKIRLKALGDPQVIPNTQNLGMYLNGYSADDLEIFCKLAKAYVIEGTNQASVCDTNANLAFQFGKDEAAQAWLLMGSLLTNLLPDDPPTPPASNHLIHSLSAPAVITSSSYSFPAKPATARTLESAPAIMRHTHTSPSRTSLYGKDTGARHSASGLGSRRATPTSSNSPSPHLGTTALPSLGPSRHPSIVGRRESVDSEMQRHPSSMYRRPSSSIPSIHSASPSDKGNNLRHVGEGALDDSDSSGSGNVSDIEDILIGSSDEEISPRPLISPAVAAMKGTTVQPSPLSRVAGQRHWTEDDEEEKEDTGSSPSPRSTDTESGSSSPHPREASGHSRRNLKRVQNRSRSSTVASLAAPANRPLLATRRSHSSIRTVTAGEVSFHDKDIRVEETLRDIRRGSLDQNVNAHKRQKSQAISEPALNAANTIDHPEVIAILGKNNLARPKQEIIRDAEKSVREIGWDALREILEYFADEGDVQTCSMLSLVGSQELGLDSMRVVRFLDSYIDMLTRFRLYTCAAYLRKHSQIADIRLPTQLETIIYTSCGKCRKPLVVPAGSSKSKLLKGGFAYCSTCKAPSITCAICRLPIRTLLFQCSVCTHGGHEACYRRYYMERPMVEIPGSFINMTEKRGSSISRTNSLASQDDDDTASSTTEPITEISSPINPTRDRKLMGHPCAAGCGHMCWAANEDV